MKQLIRFVTVGVLNTILGYCVIFAFMYLFKFSPEVSNFIGYLVGLVASYFLNRIYTFNSKQDRRSEVFKFISVFIMAYALNFAVLLILIHVIYFHEGVSQLIAGFFYVIASFVMNKYYVFKIPKRVRVVGN